MYVIVGDVCTAVYYAVCTMQYAYSTYECTRIGNIVHNYKMGECKRDVTVLYK